MVSIADVGELAQGFRFLSRSGSQKWTAPTEQILNGFSHGIDKARPTVVLVTTGGVAIRAKALVPIGNFDVTLAGLPEKSGESAELADGIFESTGPFPMICQTAPELGICGLGSPRRCTACRKIDPVQLLEDIHQEHELAVHA